MSELITNLPESVKQSTQKTFFQRRNFLGLMSKSVIATSILPNEVVIGIFNPLINAKVNISPEARERVISKLSRYPEIRESLRSLDSSIYNAVPWSSREWFPLSPKVASIKRLGRLIEDPFPLYLLDEFSKNAFPSLVFSSSHNAEVDFTDSVLEDPEHKNDIDWMGKCYGLAISGILDPYPPQMLVTPYGNFDRYTLTAWQVAHRQAGLVRSMNLPNGSPDLETVRKVLLVGVPLLVNYPFQSGRWYRAVSNYDPVTDKASFTNFGSSIRMNVSGIKEAYFVEGDGTPVDAEMKSYAEAQGNPNLNPVGIKLAQTFYYS